MNKTAMDYLFDIYDDMAKNNHLSLTSITDFKTYMEKQYNTFKKLSSNAIMIFANADYGGKHDRGEGVAKREFMYFSNTAQDNMAKLILNLFAKE